MNDPVLNYSSLTIIPNSSYLNDIHHTSTDPLSSSTMGLMMLLSTLQYQAPYTGSTYSNAASQAGKAAFVVSGGQAFQDRFSSFMGRNVLDTAHSVGLTDSELGIFLGTARIVKNRKLDINGPKIYFVKTHLTLTPNDGSIGLKYEW